MQTKTTKATTKDQAYNTWQDLPSVQPETKVVPLPYGKTGSSYGACGIRIDGTPEFIDAVLSQLKGMMTAENGVTRLELARRPVEARTDFGNGHAKHFGNTAKDSEVCYIRVHERSPNAQMAQGSRTLKFLADNPDACQQLGYSHEKVLQAYARATEQELGR